MGRRPRRRKRGIEAIVLGAEFDQFLPVNFLFSDPANLRLNSSSAIVGGANAGNGTANTVSVAINSGT